MWPRLDQRSRTTIVNKIPFRVTGLTYQHLCWDANPRITSSLRTSGRSPSCSEVPVRATLPRLQLSPLRDCRPMLPLPHHPVPADNRIVVRRAISTTLQHLILDIRYLLLYLPLSLLRRHLPSFDQTDTVLTSYTCTNDLHSCPLITWMVGHMASV